MVDGTEMARRFALLFPWERRVCLDALADTEFLALERAAQPPADGHVDYAFEQQRIRRGMPLKRDHWRVCPVIRFPRAITLAAVAVLLSGCTGQPSLQHSTPGPNAQWADMWGRARGDDALNADMFACDYDIRRLQLAAGPVFPGVWHECMAARGWRQTR